VEAGGGSRPGADPESDGFATLYRETWPRLVAALRLAAPWREDVEDVAQEAFARTLLRWPRVRSGANPGGYAYRVAFRLIFKRRPITGELFDRNLDDPAHAQPDPATAVAQAIDIRAALARLPARQRAVVVLCLFNGFDAVETAAILGTRPATVRVHLHRARLVLQESLAEHRPSTTEPFLYP
jgi:RNA polymerase sigma factor (sigma-70 family)